MVLVTVCRIVAGVCQGTVAIALLLLYASVRCFWWMLRCLSRIALYLVQGTLAAFLLPLVCAVWCCYWTAKELWALAGDVLTGYESVRWWYR